MNGYNNDRFIDRRWPPNYGLYRLNLSNGAVETILKPNIDSSGKIIYGYFSLSPNETKLIYSWWDKPIIFLRNFATLDEQNFSLPENYKISGPFVWSPNGMSVIFTIWSDAREYPPIDFILVRMDMKDKSMHYLYSDNEKNRFFVPVDWVKDNVVYLADRRSNSWQINPLTGQLQKRIQPTP